MEKFDKLRDKIIYSDIYNNCMILHFMKKDNFSKINLNCIELEKDKALFYTVSYFDLWRKNNGT